MTQTHTTKPEIILISFLGPDQPNQFTRLMSVLDTHGLTILDMGQGVIHDQLTLGLVVTNAEQRGPERATSMALAMRDMLFIGQELGLTVRFKPILANEHSAWVAEGGQHKHIVTVLARRLSAADLQAVTKVISGHGFNIVNLNRLSKRVDVEQVALPDSQSSSEQVTCFEFEVKGALTDAKALRMDCLKLAKTLNVDVAVQEDSIYRRNRRLVCFDMDSTLIEQEVIVELAKAAGVGDDVHAITEAAMRGELDFNQSFAKRVALLKGLSTEVLDGIANSLTITEGAHKLVSTLKALGFKTAILSGGFTYFARYLQDKLGIDEVHANTLDISDGVVTGEVKLPIVDGARKAVLLEQIATREQLNLQQVIAVGDGANDLPMLAKAGLGVAFRAKPLVQENASQALSNLGLDGILYLLGVGDEDQKKLQK